MKITTGHYKSIACSETSSLMTGQSQGLHSLAFLPPNLVKSRGHEIGFDNDRIALKFVSHLGGATADVPAKFQSDWKSSNPNLAAWKLHKILWQDVRPVSE